MAYINPLHVDASNYESSPSTISDALTNSHGSLFLVPDRRQLPQAAYRPACKWNTSMNAGSSLHAPILFDYKGYHKQGVPVNEIRSRGASALSHMMAGANDPVFAQSGLQRILLRIPWPGYDHLEYSRPIDVVTAQGPITRGQLASTVATFLCSFMEKAAYQATSDRQWQVGPGRIRIENVVLVALYNVFGNIWQADIAIDRL